jgi:cytochrome d ubiquinol oxidase subunit I
VTGTGRQPFVIYGHLRTVDAVSPLTPTAVLTSLLLFAVVCNVLLLAFFFYGIRVVLRGPSDPALAQANAVRPGLEQAGPALVGGPAAASPVPAE